MKKNFLLPGIAIIGGIIGFFLRKWELRTAFEPTTGLPIAGVPATYALLALSFGVAAALLLGCWKCRTSLPYDQMFYAKEQPVFLLVTVVSAFCLLVSAGAEMILYPTTYQTALLAAEEDESMSRLPMFLPPLRILLGIVGFLCVLWIARNLFRAKGKGNESLAILGLCLMFCVWLISDYQVRAADPVILDYVYEIFAICAALLALYELATFSFQTGRPRLTTVLSLLAVYFSLVTLADRHELADFFRFGFIILFLTPHVVLLLRQHPAGDSPAEMEASDHA